MSNPNESKLKLTCVRCQQVWSVDHYQPEISNNLRSSTVSLAHPNLVKCPNSKCCQAYVIMVQGCQLVLNCQAVGDDVVAQAEGSSIIKPALSIVQ